MNRSATAFLAALVIGGSAAALAIAEPWQMPLVGVASAVDGDTIRINGARVRLAGIDAPESGQTCSRASAAFYACGEMATAALRQMLSRDPRVTCQATATDRYKRTIATCRNGEGDLGARMVATGNAVAYRRYSLAYVDQEAAAKAERIGIWQGSFEEPERWRHRRVDCSSHKTIPIASWPEDQTGCPR